MENLITDCHYSSYNWTLLKQNIMYLKNLVTLRKQKGWSQEKLAQEAGISYNTLIKLERSGIKNPKIVTVIKLTGALEVSLYELVGRKGF